MTGFGPRIAGVGSDRSSNCVTTTSKIDPVDIKVKNTFCSVKNARILHQSLTDIFNMQYCFVMFLIAV